MDRHLLLTQSSKPASAPTLIFAGIAVAIVLSSGHQAGQTFLAQLPARFAAFNDGANWAAALWTLLIAGLGLAAYFLSKCAPFTPAPDLIPASELVKPRPKMAPVLMSATVAALCFAFGLAIRLNYAPASLSRPTPPVFKALRPMPRMPDPKVFWMEFDKSPSGLRSCLV